MLKGLEGDCQEEEEKKADQVKGSAGAKAQTCETGAALRSMAGSSVSQSKGFGWPMEGIWGNNAGLQMAWYFSLGNLIVIFWQVNSLSVGK